MLLLNWVKKTGPSDVRPARLSIVANRKATGQPAHNAAFGSNQSRLSLERKQRWNSRLFRGAKGDYATRWQQRCYATMAGYLCEKLNDA